MSKIWFIFLFVGLLFSLISGTYQEVANVIVSSGMDSFKIFLKIALLMFFWNGIFQIAKDLKLTKYITKILKKPLSFIFKNIDKDSLCMEYIASNVASNLLGLGACATPIGFKVMEELQKNNTNKNIATRDMIKFVLINISTLSVIPTTILGFRLNENTKYDVTVLCIFVSLFSFITTLLFETIINTFNR